MLLEELATKSGVGVQSPNGITPSNNAGSVDWMNSQMASAPPAIGPTSVDPNTAVKEPAKDWRASTFDALENFRNDVGNVIRNPSVIPAQMRVGLEKGVAGLKLRALDEGVNSAFYGNEDRSPITPEQQLAKRQEVLSGLDATDALQAGINEVAGPKSYLGKALQGVTTSIGMQLPTMPLMLIAPETAPLLIGSMFFGTYGDKYQERIKAGYSPEQADKSATWHGVTEVGTEFIGLPYLTKVLKAVKAGKTMTKEMLGELLTENIGEQAATFLQTGEDMYTEGFKKSKGAEAVSKWIGSPEFYQGMIDTAVATTLQTGAMGAGLSPIKASYRTKALKQAGMLESTIQQAKADGQDSVIIAGKSIPITELENQQKDMAETWDISPVEVQAYAKDSSNPIADETQQIVDKAIEDVLGSGLINQTKEDLKGVENGQSTSETGTVDQGTDSADASGGSEQRGSDGGLEGNDAGKYDAVSDVQRIGDGTEGGQSGLSADSGTRLTDGNVVGQATAFDDAMYLQHDSTMAESGVKDSIINTPSIPDYIANTFERIHAKLGTAGKVVMISAEELQNTAYGKWLQGLMKARSSAYTVDNISGGRAYNGLVDPTTGKTFHLVALSDQALASNTFTGIVGMHEVLGHIVDYEHFENAPEAIKNKIKSDFDGFFQRLVNGESIESLFKSFAEPSASRLASAEKILSKGVDETQEEFYQRIFKEWKAHKISEAIIRSTPAQTIMERFWDKIATKFKELYNDFKDSNADIVTNVKSVEEFVNYLYSKQESVENFNIKVSGKYRDVVKAVFESITTVEDGKIVIKPAWLKPATNKAGKTILALRKILTRYVMRDKETGAYSYSLEAIRTGHAQTALYTVQKNLETNSWDIAIREMVPVLDHEGKPIMFGGKPKTSGKITEVLASIPVDRMLGIKGVGAGNTAYQLAQNIRDMLIILDGSKPELRTSPKFIEGFLQTTEGKAIKIKIPALDKRLQSLYADAVILAPEYNLSSAQMFLSIFTKDFGAVAPGFRGVAGQEIPENTIIFDRLERGAKILEKLSPGFAEKITSSLSGVAPLEHPESEKVQVEEIDREQIAESATVAETWQSAIEGKVDELIQNALPKKGKKVDSAKIFDELSWRYMNELKGVEKNWAEAYAKSAIESLVGESVAIQLKDNVRVEKIAKELRDIGAIVLSGTNEQLADDLIVSADKIALLADEEILGSYHDAVDGIDKLILDDKNMKYKIASQPGSTFIAKSLKGGIKLGDLIQHETLFKALPRLKDAKVIYYRSAALKGGFTQIKHGIIEFHINATYPRSINTLVLLHEIQHGVQLLEGFAYGSSPVAMKDFRMAFDTSDKRWKYLMQKYNDHVLYEHAGGEAEARFVAALYKNKITKDNIGDPLELLAKLANVELGDRIYLEPLRTRLSMQEDSILLSVPNNTSDEVTQAAFERVYQDDLAVSKDKLKKIKRPKIRTEGPYADILNEQIKKKESKPRAKLDPAKLQARRDKMNLFVQSMTTMLDEAKRKNVSLEQFMISTGKFTIKEVRVAIAKFHANTSRFSQTEIIMRLATELGFVNEDGRERLEVLIKTMFPDRTIVDPETGKKEKVLGSDGSVQSLGTIARGILIHKLQQIMIAKTGTEYNLESEETLSERKLALEKEEYNVPAYKKVFKLLKWIENDWATRLSTTPSGKELVYRLRKYMWKTIDYQRDWLIRLNEMGQAYSTPEQRDLLHQLVIGEAAPTNRREEDFVSMIRGINHIYAKEMELLQIKIQYKNGSTEYFKYNPEESDSYFPHMWEYGTFDKPNEKMIQSLIDSNEASTRAQAIKLMKTYKLNYIRSQKFANIEQARETELGGWIEDPIKVYQKYITQTSKRLAQLREFGATPELALSQFALKHFKEGKSSQALQDARDVINQTLGVKVEEGLMQEPKFGMTYGIMLASGTMLQHALFVQPGTATNMAMVGGFKNLVKGIAQVLPSLWGNRTAEYQVRYAKLAGVLAFTMNKELYDIVLDDKIREKSDKVLRSFGVTQVDSAMRIVGAMVGKLYAVEIALDYAKKQTPKGFEKLRRLGLNPDSIVNRAEPGVLNPEELRMSALAFTEETNFVTNPLATPVMLKNHPLGRIFMLFSRFAFQQHHLWKTVLASDSKLALRGVLAGFAVGTPMMLLKMLLTGDDPEKVLKRDGIGKMLWKAFTTGSGPGLFAEAFGNAVFQASGKQTGGGGGAMAIDSPAFAMLDTIGKGIKASSKIAFGKDHTDSDVNKAFKGAYQALQMTVLGRLPAQVGVPLNAALGFARPFTERGFYPSENQKKGSYLQ